MKKFIIGLATILLSILTSCFILKGQASNNWHCPDNMLFPPVNIHLWNKVPVVNGRLPTYQETQNGISLIYFDKKKTPDAKPYNMILPRLASFFCPYTKKK